MCNVIDAEDLMSEARLLIEAVFMATSSLPLDEGGPLAMVANIAVQRLDQARDLLDGYRRERDAAEALGQEGS